MHIQDTQDKFVELRAQGWSLAHIATELHTSKRTLVEWNREFAADIQSFRTMEQELLREKFLATRDEELNRLTRLQKDVDDELASRPLYSIPIDKLFRLAIDLRHEIQQLRIDPSPEEEESRSETDGQNADADEKAHPLNGGRPRHRPRRLPPGFRKPSSPLEPLASEAPVPAESEPAERRAVQAEESEPHSSADSPPPMVPVNCLVPPTAPPSHGESPVAADGVSKNPAEAAMAKPSQDTPGPAKRPQEHCLTCGAEVPKLLPNGQRPSHYCKCGHPLPPPGTSLREDCPKCGLPLPVHGPNAQRPCDTCGVCGTRLLPLDPKLPFPWVPPNRRSNLP